MDKRAFRIDFHIRPWAREPMDAEALAKVHSVNGAERWIDFGAGSAELLDPDNEESASFRFLHIVRFFHNCNRQSHQPVLSGREGMRRRNSASKTGSWRLRSRSAAKPKKSHC
jgi:hypothetical protein